MKPERDRKPVPGRGGYEIELVEVGPPDHVMPMPPTKLRGKLIPLGTGEGVPEGIPYRPGPGLLLRKRVPLIPTAKEIDALPRLARLAFASRCAQRVQSLAGATLPQADDASVAETVAHTVKAIVEAATLDSPVAAQLRCIRRDFLRLKNLVRKEKWTDDTPVPADAFGSMWPEGVAPEIGKRRPLLDSGL